MTPVIGWNQPLSPQNQRDYGPMGPSRFDLITSSFVAMMLMLGLWVATLLLMWLLLNVEPGPQPISPSGPLALTSATSGEGRF